jgi:hypothetical protein
VFSPSNQTHRQGESGVPTLCTHYTLSLRPTTALRSSLWRGPPNSDPSTGEAWHPYPAVKPLSRRSLVPPSFRPTIRSLQPTTALHYLYGEGLQAQTSQGEKPGTHIQLPDLLVEEIWPLIPLEEDPLLKGQKPGSHLSGVRAVSLSPQFALFQPTAAQPHSLSTIRSLIRPTAALPSFHTDSLSTSSLGLPLSLFRHPPPCTEF